MLEFNNSNCKIIGGIQSEYSIKSNNSGLSVRIYADQIKITDVLKLVEFTINNKEKKNKHLIKKTIELNNYKGKALPEPLLSITDDELISRIKKSKLELIIDVISDKIPIHSQKIYQMGKKYIHILQMIENTENISFILD